MDKFWMIVNINGGNGARPIEYLDSNMRPKAMYYNREQAVKVAIAMAKKIPSGNFALLEAIEVLDQTLTEAIEGN